MAATLGASTEQFEAFFQRADLDRDGRISGAEAVAFFKGANLPQQVLAQIWAFADQNQSGFLNRPSFYNALKLVTVAQRKMQLTPEIVKSALYGPASAKIPAPQINLAVISTPQPGPTTAVPSSQMSNTAQPTSQNIGFRGQSPASLSANQQFQPVNSSPGVNLQLRQDKPSSTAINQQFRPVQPSSQGQQFGQIQPSSMSMNTNFGQAPLGTNMSQQFIPSQSNQSMRPPSPIPTGPASAPQSAAGASIPSGSSQLGTGFPNLNDNTNAASTAPVTQDMNRGGSPSVQPVAQAPPDQFSAFSSIASQDSRGPVGSIQRSSSDPNFGGNMMSTNQSLSQQGFSTQQHPASSSPTSLVTVPGASAPQPSAKPDPFEALRRTVVNPSTGLQGPQAPLLPMSNQQIPTYTASPLSSSGGLGNVGSPIPEQSQNPWPRMTRASIQKYTKVFMEVDTDRDGKITGSQARNLFLSWRLPQDILKQVWDLSDQDSDSMLSLREFCIALYLMEQYRGGRSLPSVLPNSVMHEETLLSLAGPPVGYSTMGWGPSTGFRSQQGMSGVPPIAPTGLRPPVHPTALQNDGSMQFSHQNARSLAVGDDRSLNTKGLEPTETKERVENTEKVLLDSREKLEFYRTKMQDLVLYKSRCENRLNEITERARADKTEAELLEKKYQEKYKQVAEIHSKLTIEEASFREIQERKMELRHAIIKIEQGGSADGILQVRADRILSDLEELMRALTDRCNKHNIEMKPSMLIELPPGWTPGVQEVASIWDEDWDKFEDDGFSLDTAVPENVKSKEHSSPTGILSPDAVSDADASSEKHSSTIASAFETESAYSADETKSPQESPREETTLESPSHEYSDKHFRKSSDEDDETRRSFDSSAWGNFDNNDDIDSVWGFNAKESVASKPEEKYFFGSTDFGEKADSPSAFHKKSPFIFEDSVPATPLSRAANSPPSRYSFESRDPFSDNFSRYDSFSARGRSSSPPRGTHARFDSISSTSGFDQSRKFSFDDSTSGFDQSRKFSFDDSDPFGSGPFKVVSSETPKKGSEWSSF